MQLSHLLLVFVPAAFAAEEVCETPAPLQDGAEEVPVPVGRGESYLQTTHNMAKNQNNNNMCECNSKAGGKVPQALLMLDNSEAAQKYSPMPYKLPDAECLPFCTDTGCPCLKPWVQRCAMKSCGACAECGGPGPLPPIWPTPTPSPYWPTHPPVDPRFTGPASVMHCPLEKLDPNAAATISPGQKPGDNPGATMTTACLSQQGYDQISNSVREQLRSLPDTCDEFHCPRADWSGCILRMAGHDFMDFDGFRGGADACTDMEDGDNNGLLECLATGEFGISLQDSYIKFCGTVSLADFLVIAAEAVILETRQWAVQEKPGMVMDLKSKFMFGRTTAIEACRYVQGSLPNPENGCDDVQKVFMQRMHLTAAEATALMGVHTLGRAHPKNSGYSGWWSDPHNSRLFNNNYYISIIAKGWMPNRTMFGNPNKNQWSRSDVGRMTEHGGMHEMMLNTDMCLAYEEGWKGMDAKFHNCCAWMDPPNQAHTTGLSVEVIQATGGMNCGAPVTDPGQKSLEVCCNGVGGLQYLNPHDPDCGNPAPPLAFGQGLGGKAVMDFAGNEALWLSTFMDAWGKATTNGFFGQLKPLQAFCP